MALCKKNIIIFLGILILSVEIFAFAYPLISLRIITKTIYAPALFGVYSKDIGMLQCQLYGVASIEKAFNNRLCEITPKAAKEMRHFAMQYTRNKIFLEEQHRAGYKKGWCFLQNGAHLFNAEIVRDGYGVVQYFDTSEQKILEDLEKLEQLAKKERKGLWREWAKEMQCLKTSLNAKAKELQK